MDTDDLTPMAYRTLSLVYEACQPLRAEIGASASNFLTEDEFLHGASDFMTEIIEDPEGYLDSWDLLDDVRLRVFVEKVRSVQAHIATTLDTPRVQRGKPPFERAVSIYAEKEEIKDGRTRHLKPTAGSPITNKTTRTA